MIVYLVVGSKIVNGENAAVSGDGPFKKNIIVCGPAYKNTKNWPQKGRY